MPAVFDGRSAWNRVARILDAFRGTPVQRRKILLTATWLAVGAVMVVALVLAILSLTATADLADRMAEVGAVFAGAALLLAAIAAAVALLAYTVSTGLPEVLLKVEIEGTAVNNFVLEAKMNDDVGLMAKHGPLTGTVFLHNTSGYSANNPAVVIRLDRMVFRRSVNDLTRGWDLIDSDARGVTRAIQWDGGPTYSIHGDSTRRLPDFPLGYLWYTGEDGSAPTMTVEILAEGYKKMRSFSINFILENELQFALSENASRAEWV